jgi:hypothetical protein
MVDLLWLVMSVRRILTASLSFDAVQPPDDALAERASRNLRIIAHHPFHHSFIGLV